MTARRGFTLIELMTAVGISTIVMAAILAALYGVWSLAKDASDELQGALQARAIRERLYYGLVKDKSGDARYGLIGATNITVTSKKLVARFPDGTTKTITSKATPFYLDSSSSRKYHASNMALQNVYLAFNPGSKASKPDSNKTMYYDRIVVPTFGLKPAKAASADELDEVVNVFKNNY